MPPTPRRNSVGSATPELLTPRSYSGRQNGYFKETRRLSTTPLNFVAISKEDTMSTYASVCGSESGSPRLNWKTGNWYVTMFCLFSTLSFVLFCCCAFHLLQWNLVYHTMRHVYKAYKHAMKLHFSGVQNIKSGFNQINTTMIIGIWYLIIYLCRTGYLLHVWRLYTQLEPADTLWIRKGLYTSVCLWFVRSSWL